MKKYKETEIGVIPGDWEIAKLSEVAEILTGFPFKSSEYSFDSGIVVIRGENIAEKKLRWDNVKRWRKIDNNIKKYLLKEGIIVVSMDGNVGKNKAIIRNADLPALLAQRVAAIIAKENISQYFINLAILSDQFFKYCERVKTGTTIAHISKNQIENLLIPLPSLKEQQAIAKILSDLDEKIELNNQMNKTLENIAQAIFKRWFIDFEFPNENGEPYKSSGGEMVESELGMIPKGWIVDILGHLLKTIESGKRPKGGIDQTLSTGIPSIGAENINGLGYYDYSRTKYISEEFFREIKEGIIRDKDVLLYKDGAQLGRKTMFGSGFPFDLCCVNEHVFILRSNEFLNQFFLYFWLDQNKVTEDIKNLNSNSAQPGLNRESLRKLKILVPEKSILGRFENTISALIEKIFLNSLESRNISLARDLLLPKLMTGKIRVPLEEQNVE